MTDFEDQLRRALDRKEPSPDFAARVAARANAARHQPWFTRPAWAITAIAASMILGAVNFQLDSRDRRQGQAARAQLIEAMQITSTQLDKIHNKVRGALR